MNKTPINHILDISEPENGYNKDHGYGKIDQETYEREEYMKGPVKGKIRQSQNYSNAMNGGMVNTVQDYFAREPEPQQYSNFDNHIYASMEQQPVVPQINCIDIISHVQACPLCSKFYNNDRTFYIISILVLLAVCLLLSKKLLDKL
jgi:hypothetical protein